MGIFGNNRGAAPRGAAGLGAALAAKLRGRNTFSEPEGRQPRRRGNAPEGAAGLGAALGAKLRGRNWT